MNLKYSILPISALMFLAGCSSDITSPDSTERLELGFNTSLSSAVVSRASANQFAANSKLLAFVRHVEGASKDNYNDVDAELDRLVTLKVNADESVSVDGTPLYWDDFSKSAISEKDIRATNHGLQSYYGYCYNGGTPESLTKATGTLEWNAITAPASADDIQHTDLLWSAAQDMITYSHASVKNGKTDTLSVPFTHAMSEFTVVLEAGNGFSDKALKNTTVTLHSMNSKGTFTAPTATVEGSAAADFTMYSPTPAEDTDVKSRTYVAMTVPGTVLSTENTFLSITDAEGNDYTYYLTADNLETAWATALAKGKTLPGYNYHLTITLNKSGVSVVASLTDWITVEAAGEGIIDFTADVKSHNIANKLTEGNAFNLWMTAATAYTASSTRTAEYTANGLSLNSPIYWPNGTDTYYFRAEANYDGEKLTTLGEGDDATVVNQGQDRVWATTAAHKASNATKTYNEGEAIAPRTGSVPLEFKHVMSKITINLTTPSAAEGAAEAETKHVDLTDAQLSLSDVLPAGSLDIHTGEVTASGTKESITGTTAITNKIVVPQSTENMILTVTLKDGTKYKFNLANTKVVTNGTTGTTTISSWTSGNAYTYTINISKQGVELLGYVKDWIENKGSGDAELIWDDETPTEP